MVQSRDEIIRLIEKNRDTIRSYGVKRLGLFGSFARNRGTDESDLDFVVELEIKSFDTYMGLKFFLEELFHSPVDLVLMDTIKPRLRSVILEETVYASGF